MMGYNETKFSVWKFSLEDFDDWGEPIFVKMPMGAEILTVRVQTGLYGTPEIVLYAKVDPEMSEQKRVFAIYPTGMEWGQYDRMSYIETVEKRNIVVHVFELFAEDE